MYIYIYIYISCLTLNSISLSVCVCVCVCLYIYIWVDIDIDIDRVNLISIYLSICRSTYLCIYRSTSLFLYLYLLPRWNRVVDVVLDNGAPTQKYYILATQRFGAEMSHSVLSLSSVSVQAPIQRTVTSVTSDYGD